METAEIIWSLVGVGVGATLSYLGFHLRRPTERRDTLLNKVMADRWDAAMDLRRSLGELEHCIEWVGKGNASYVDRARSFAHEARAQARGPMLGGDVWATVKAFTDQVENFLSSPDEKATPASTDENPEITVLRGLVGNANAAIDARLKILPGVGS